MDIKNAIDKYVTDGPNYDLDQYCEMILEEVSDKFYNENREWLEDVSGDFNTKLNALYNTGVDVKTAAEIIEATKL